MKLTRGRAGQDEEAGKGVSQIVKADVPQSSGLQAGVECFSIGFVGHAVSGGTKEYPAWHLAIRPRRGVS